MKRYIRSATVIQNAKQLSNAVKAELERLGFEEVRNDMPYRGRPGTTGAKIFFDYRYHPVDEKEEYRLLQGEYAAEYGVDRGQAVLRQKEAGYNNFLVIQQITGYSVDLDQEDSHDSIRHTGGGFGRMDADFLQHMQDYVNSICPEADVKMERSGLLGIETTIDLLLFVPKQV